MGRVRNVDYLRRKARKRYERIKHTEAYRARQRVRQQLRYLRIKNTDAYKAKQRARNQHARQARLAKLGLTIEQFDELVLAQDEQCAICPTRPTRWHVHVDSQTGAVRGLLCWRCRSGFRWFRDSTAQLALALDYMRRTDGNVSYLR